LDAKNNVNFASKTYYKLTPLNPLIMELKEIISNIFTERFGGEGTFYASAGRINLIGEHTDYNGGFVFPGAIDKVIMAEIRANGSNKVRVFSVDIDDYAEFGLNEADAPEQSWARYIFGVCREIIKRGGKVEGFDAVFAGNVPLGAGLSSSAALESCFAFAMNDMFNGNTIEKFELARIGQSTEHNYCGVNCGIMDQFASVFGKQGNLMRLDCRSGEFEYFPFNPQGYTLVLVDSVVKHELADSPYNKRRQSCERVAKRLGVETLRDATMEMLDASKGDITAEDYFRAKYVIEEKQRVLDVCDALNAGDYETVGRCMYETHRGLSKDYEVSCEELDYLNDLAKECGVTGSRIMGGGFGGCTINLVKNELLQKFTSEARARFNEKYGHEPKIYEVIISDGARRL
jgi:galactokinase